MSITKLLHCSLTLDEIPFLYNCKLEMLSSLKVKSNSNLLGLKENVLTLLLYIGEDLFYMGHYIGGILQGVIRCLI